MDRKSTLENGIRVVTEAMAEARTISIGLLIDVSPRDEDPARTGLAQLTEHALFQGTRSRDALQIVRLIDSAGGRRPGGLTASLSTSPDEEDSIMAKFQIDPVIKKNWEELQKQHGVPINAIGVKIDPKDQATLSVWKQLEIDRFLRR